MEKSFVSRPTCLGLVLAVHETDTFDDDGEPRIDLSHTFRWDIVRQDAETFKTISTEGSFTMLQSSSDDEWSVSYDNGSGPRYLASSADTQSANDLIRVHYARYARRGKVFG